LLHCIRYKAISVTGTFYGEWHAAGTGFQLHFDAVGGKTEEPNPIVVSSRMTDGQLFRADVGMRELELSNDFVNVPQTCSCGLTLELSGHINRAAIDWSA